MEERVVILEGSDLRDLFVCVLGISEKKATACREIQDGFCDSSLMFLLIISILPLHAPMLVTAGYCQMTSQFGGASMRSFSQVY